jgi:hypothetical protein
LDFGNDPWWIGIIGDLKINDQDEMEIDWIDRIPWQYRDFKSLYNGEVSNVLPPHRSFDHAIDIQPGTEPPWGPINALSENSYQYSRNTLRKCSIRERSAQASRQRVHPSFLFWSLMAGV